MPTDLAALLDPRQLELLQEIAFELEDVVLDSEDSALHDFQRLLLEATGHSPRTKAGRTRGSGEPGTIERERLEEFTDELRDDEKEGRRLPAVPSREEMLHLLETVKDEHERDYVIIRLFYATGCRRSELVKMRLADLCLKEQRIFVRDGKEWDSYCTSSFFC